jgi:thioredoxin-dependent peroxiredoxin
LAFALAFGFAFAFAFALALAFGFAFAFAFAFGSCGGASFFGDGPGRRGAARGAAGWGTGGGRTRTGMPTPRETRTRTRARTLAQIWLRYRRLGTTHGWRRIRMPEEGARAPDFSLQGVGDGGEEVFVRLSELEGRPVVLYFYPKDDTPGCTKQACGIRDEWAAFRATGAEVLGVSPDDVASHRAFAEKHQLPFTLLSDPDHAVAEAYGVWVEKSMYGRKLWGVERSTFVIDADGRVKGVRRRVRPEEHAGWVLEVLEA